MLHPKYNRIDYGEQLIPPEQYELSYAIGTTYSLDLEAFMILPVALFYSQQLESNTDVIRYDMLEAITKAADNIIIYYQKGQLKVPHKYNFLMAYLEKGIQPIVMQNHVSSFHPKVWVARYECHGAKPKYRVLIASRNLTLSRDWDIAFSTDGIVSEKEQSGNKALVDFLQYLITEGTKKPPDSFLSDLMKVRFDAPDGFESFAFMPIGIPNPEKAKPYMNPITAPRKKWEDLLIISPFLDKTTLYKIAEMTAISPYLLSSKVELDAIDEETLDMFECYQFNTYFEHAEYISDLEDGGMDSIDQNLHAKLFVAIHNQTPYWYLGSANCTDPAQSRNIEFMVELKGKVRADLKPNGVFKALTNPEKSDGVELFTLYNPEVRVIHEEQRKIELDIRRIKYDLTKLQIKGVAALIEGTVSYTLTIEIDANNLSLPSGYKVKLRPLPEQQKEMVELKPGSVNKITDFRGYTETVLSIFLVFEISKADVVHSQFLLPMEIELPNTRLSRIFTAIIDSREKFLKYLAFLLTGEETEPIRNVNPKLKRTSNSGNDPWAFAGTPVYEKLLIAASRHSERLRSIDRLIQRLKEESAEKNNPIISTEFEDFWKVFQSFIKDKNP